jgi:hypothetical protein
MTAMLVLKLMLLEMRKANPFKLNTNLEKEFRSWIFERSPTFQ